MEAIKTSYANILLTGEGCLDLPAAVWPAEDRPGMLNFETAWKPTADELADLLAGGTLYINHLVPKGLGFPPVLPTTRTLFEDSREANWEGTREGVRLSSGKLRKTLEALEHKPAGSWLTEDNREIEPEEVKDIVFRISAVLKALYSLEHPDSETSWLIGWLMLTQDIEKLEQWVKEAKPLETLTIAEMEKMDGEPVWVVMSNDEPETAHCCVVWAAAHGVEVPGMTEGYSFEDYGKKWLAYRDRPKGGKGNE